MKPKALILDFVISVLLSVLATRIVLAVNHDAPGLAALPTCVVINLFIGAAMSAGYALGRRA